MTMSATQIGAFQAAAGFTPASSNTLWTGIAMGILLLWGVWVLLSIYRGWPPTHVRATTHSYQSRTSR
ncbi:TIGR03758 family integrating conjugative element protein [Pseudomonas syringae]|uniref:TIGR03758 family integrating conjugative element protein n=1 Tax=Pseudomonas syringae TaxID=317 RepID=UPI0009B1983C